MSRHHIYFISIVFPLVKSNRCKKKDIDSFPPKSVHSNKLSDGKKLVQRPAQVVMETVPSATIVLYFYLQRVSASVEGTFHNVINRTVVTTDRFLSAIPRVSFNADTLLGQKPQSSEEQQLLAQFTRTSFDVFALTLRVLDKNRIA